MIPPASTNSSCPVSRSIYVHPGIGTEMGGVRLGMRMEGLSRVGNGTLGCRGVLVVVSWIVGTGVNSTGPMLEGVIPTTIGVGEAELLGSEIMLVVGRKVGRREGEDVLVVVTEEVGTQSASKSPRQRQVTSSFVAASINWKVSPIRPHANSPVLERTEQYGQYNFSGMEILQKHGYSNVEPPHCVGNKSPYDSPS